MVNGVWQLALESEWSPNRDTVIPYGITVKTRFGTKPQIPICEIQGITHQQYIARQNALIYDANSIETEILNKIKNNIDPIINDNILSLIKHEDVDTINTLLESETITNKITGKTIGNIVEDIKMQFIMLQLMMQIQLKQQY